MQLVWLIPSLAYGIFTFVSTGQIYGLVFSGFSALAMLASQLFQGKREAVDLQQPVRFGGGRVAIGNRVLPKWQVLWQAPWLTRVFRELQEINREQNAELALNSRLSGTLAAERNPNSGLRSWLGFTGSQELVLDLTVEGAHALIVGATGSGKSQLLATWLVSLCQGYSPQELSLWLVDYKGGAALGSFEKLPWSAGLFTDLSGDALAALERIEAELTSRERLLAKLGMTRIQDIGAGNRPPYLLVAIDEAQALLQDPRTHRILEALAARGRSLGIHLILTAQSLSGIPRGLFTNLGARIAVGRCDPVDLAQLGLVRSKLDSQPQMTPQLSPLTATNTWAQAVLIGPSRQQKFNFPSAGTVTASRLLTQAEFAATPSGKLLQVDFSAAGRQKGRHISPSPTESVVSEQNQFGFSIGL